jgi:mono/diheme cytochrome c family protein
VLRAPAYAWRVQLHPRALVVLAIALTACGEPAPELREWRPSDHQQPAAGEPAAAGGAVAPPEEQSPEQTEIRAASALFSSMCASCHGQLGRGDGPGRPPVAEVADLTTAEWQDARTDEQIAEVIREGRGGFMPGFGDRLSPAGVDALVRHVRRLGGRGATEDAGEAEGEDGAAAAEPVPEVAPGTETAPEATAPATAAEPAPETAPATGPAPEQPPEPEGETAPAAP